jgi:DNA-binding NtrC family response regulator
VSRDRAGSGEAGARILIVDDEATQREMLAGILQRAGYRVEIAAAGDEALGWLEREAFDLLLTDQRMPGMDGLALLERALSIRPGLPVILMTAHGSVSEAVAAVKKGAADYLTKPFEKDELLLVLEKSLRQRRLEEEVEALRGALKDRYRLGRIIGTSAAMREVFSMI